MADASRQLSFYHLLVSEGLGVYAEDVRLYYLRHGVEQIGSRNRKQLYETVAWVDETAAHIREEKKWMPCEGAACQTCAFWKVCPAKTGEARMHPPVWRQGELLELTQATGAPIAAKSTATEMAQSVLDL